MKQLFSVLLLISFILYSCSKEEDPFTQVDPVPEVVKEYDCKIKTRTQLRFEMKEKWVWDYDTIQNTIHESYSQNDIIVQHKINFLYDNNGNLIRYEITTGDSTPMAVFESGFNMDNKPIYNQTTHVGGYQLGYEWTYNEKGYENGMTLFTNGEKQGDSRNYNHDEWGNIIYLEGYYKDGSHTRTRVMEYNEQNDIIKETLTFGPFVSKKDETFWIYNAQNLLIEENHFSDTTLTSQNKNYEYDSMDNLLSVNMFYRGHLENAQTNTYVCFEK